MRLTSNPLFSIIIVNMNGKRYLERCLASVLSNNYPHYEVIIVDNGSTDGSIPYIKTKFAQYMHKIRIVALDKNYGPAKARNEGVKISRAEYLGFLDNDTRVDKNWIRAAKKCLSSNQKIGIVQCKLMLMRERRKIDYLGEYLGNFGFLVSVAEHGELDKGQYRQQTRILAAKSAGMFIKKKSFEKIGGFDEDYFIFVEETDLGWRGWLAGYEVVFCPDSVVYHHFSASKEIFNQEFNNFLVRFHGTKNYILTLYKNLELKNLLLILPVHVFLWFCLAGYLTLSGDISPAVYILRAIAWNIINLRRNTLKRWAIQKTRQITDDQLFETFGLMKKRNLGYWMEKFMGSQKR